MAHGHFLDSLVDDPESATGHNVRAESCFSAFNGVYLALAIFIAPVVAVAGFDATPLQLTILVSAFPVGAFLGPLWAFFGRRWGMQKLVTQMALWANVPLFFVFWLDPGDAAWFTALIAVSQLLNSAMRMGQSSMYRVLYAREIRGRVLGRLTFWSYLTIVPSILVAGWLLDADLQLCRLAYVAAGISGLIGAWFYSSLRAPAHPALSPGKGRVPAASFRAGVRGVRRVIRQDRAYLLFQFAFFLSGSAFFMSTHIVLLLTRERFEFDGFELSLALTVMPQLMLAVASPLWGRMLDRWGIVRCRLLISFLMTAYLASYLGGIVWGLAPLIYLGGILQGISNGGGQLTWALASSHFAPRVEDIPLYNGIHFVLNGVRGLMMPWVGSALLFIAGGPIAILAATLVSFGSVPIVLRSLGLEQASTEERVEEPAPDVIRMEDLGAPVSNAPAELI